MRQGRLIALLLLLAGLCTGRGAAAVDLADPALLRDFNTIAFGNEFREVRDPRVVKWTGPLHVFVQEDIPLRNDERQVLKRHLARLAAVTGLAIRDARSPDEANLLIMFTGERSHAGALIDHAKSMGNGWVPAGLGRMQRSNCLGFFVTDAESWAITRAAVAIPLERMRNQGLVRRCMVEETTQVLGLPNDSEAVKPSIFNDSSRLDDLSRRDLAMLRILYHPRLAPGMTPTEALSVAREILPTLPR